MSETSSSTTSASLLVRIQNSEDEAWSRFVKIYGPSIYEWCRKAALQPQDAVDVSQAVFTAVHLKIGTFDANRPNSNFRGWLWTVTRNKIRDHFRDRVDQEQATGGSRHHQHLSQSAELLPEQIPEDLNQDEQILIRAIELLKSDFEPRTWDAFWRAAVLKEPASQIAQDMQMSTWAIYQAKSRVLRKARQELAALIPLDDH